MTRSGTSAATLRVSGSWVERELRLQHFDWALNSGNNIGVGVQGSAPPPLVFAHASSGVFPRGGTSRLLPRGNKLISVHTD